MSVWVLSLVMCGAIFVTSSSSSSSSSSSNQALYVKHQALTSRNISISENSHIEDAQSSLHGFLLRKAEDVREVLRHGTAQLSPLDPFRMEGVKVLMQETQGFLNLTLKKVVISGLSDFKIKDVASNLEAGQASVLIGFPVIRVRGVYKLKGFLNPPYSQLINDEGEFEATIGRAGATWSTYLTPLNRDEVSVSSTDVTCFFDDVVHSFKSFAKKKQRGTAADELQETAASALVDKIQRSVEDSLIKGFGVSLSKGSWNPPPKMEQVKPKHSRISKRQVPCNNGEELDEYVKTLLSFASRIVRIMEPIGFPNFTAWIDNQLIVFLYNGRARGVSTISSRREPYVFCPNNTITLGMVVGFTELNVEMNYRVMQDYQLLLFNGEAEIRVTEPVAFVQLTQVTGERDTTQTLDRLKLWSLGRVQILLKGLGNLTKAISMLLTQTINSQPEQFINMIEDQLVNMARQQLANISVPLFSLI